MVNGSLPSRERGLKFFCVHPFYFVCTVAPLAGAWIEMYYHVKNQIGYYVAPLAGAWIEIYATAVSGLRRRSLPSRERGLKYPPFVKLCCIEHVAPLAGAWIEICVGNK